MPYSSRRERLFKNLKHNSVAIIASAPVSIRNRDVEHPYRQDSYFYYLTGFEEPNALLVLIKNQNNEQCLIFCQKKDKEKEIWDGHRLGVKKAPKALGIDKAHAIDEADKLLPELLANRKAVYRLMQAQPQLSQPLDTWLKAVTARQREGLSAPVQFNALEPILDEMRLIKDEHEIKLIKQACKISEVAHKNAMQQVKPNMYEYQLEAILHHRFRYQGSERLAYSSIVGSGDNTCVLHYIKNDAKIKEDDLILIDAGCEFGYYASDITRTFPASGKFSPEQAKLYALVLKAQIAAIDAIKPDISFDTPHQVVVKILTQGLVDLGLLEGKIESLIKNGDYRRFYMHKTGHWLGMDVHDVGDYKVNNKWRALKEGMVLTIEPGLYISPSDKSVAKKWRGIGIRIEDDILVTKGGAKVLTAGVPKEIAEIEALMS